MKNFKHYLEQIQDFKKSRLFTLHNFYKDSINSSIDSIYTKFENFNIDNPLKGQMLNQLNEFNKKITWRNQKDLLSDLINNFPELEFSSDNLTDLVVYKK